MDGFRPLDAGALEGVLAIAGGNGLRPAETEVAVSELLLQLLRPLGDDDISRMTEGLKRNRVVKYDSIIANGLRMDYVKNKNGMVRLNSLKRGSGCLLFSLAGSLSL